MNGWDDLRTLNKAYSPAPGFDKICTTSISRYIENTGNMVSTRKSTNFGEQVRGNWGNLPSLNVGYAFFAIGGAIWEDSSLKTKTNVVVVSLQLKFKSPKFNNSFSSVTAQMANSHMLISHWLMNWCICQRLCGDVIQSRDFKYHPYADNSQIVICSLNWKLIITLPTWHLYLDT